jgi:hypothetical protein
MYIKPILFYNKGKEDREAIRLLTDANIPHSRIGPVSDSSHPFIEYGPWRFHNIKGVHDFVNRYEKNKLPPL